jgi:hypothetical protein
MRGNHVRLKPLPPLSFKSAEAENIRFWDRSENHRLAENLFKPCRNDYSRLLSQTIARSARSRSDIFCREETGLTGLGEPDPCNQRPLATIRIRILPM